MGRNAHRSIGSFCARRAGWQPLGSWAASFAHLLPRAFSAACSLASVHEMPAQRSRSYAYWQRRPSSPASFLRAAPRPSIRRRLCGPNSLVQSRAVQIGGATVSWTAQIVERIKENAGKRDRVGCCSGDSVHPPPPKPRRATALRFVIPTGAKRSGGTCGFTFGTSQCAWANRFRVPFFNQRKPQVPPLRYPGFPVELGGVDELHAAFLNGKPHTWTWVRTA